MSKRIRIQEIRKSLIKILSQLDEMKLDVAAIKISEALDALSTFESDKKWIQDI